MRWASWWCRTSRSGCIEPLCLGRSVVLSGTVALRGAETVGSPWIWRLRQPLDKGVAKNPSEIADSNPNETRVFCHLK